MSVYDPLSLFILRQIAATTSQDVPAELVASVENLQADVSTLESAVPVLDARVSTLLAQVATLGSTVAPIDNRFSALETQVSTLSTSVENLDSTVGARVGNIEVEVVTLGSTVAPLDNRCSALETQVSTLSTSVENIDSTVETQLPAINAQVAALSSTINPLVSQVSTISAMVTSLETQVSSLNSLATRVSALEASSAANTPVGSILLFSMAQLPANFLACNGDLVSRSTYSALFSAIGTWFGEGDGTTTFAVPDCRGQFVRGLDAGRGLDTTARTRIAGASSDLGSTQSDQIGQHAHQMWEAMSRDSTWGDTSSTSAGGFNGGPALFFAHTNTGTTGSSETVPRNIALVYAICAF
jgi:microcystin-dependent protein/peptidoglycan hydrolase CwlO-like protein